MPDKKVDAWMPLWIGAYLADTTHLSRDQHGGYLLLLMAYWRNKGPLLDSGDRLANIVKATPAEWRRLRPILAEFFEIQGDHWSHGRAEQELQSAGLRKAAAVSKAKAAADARWGKPKEECSKHAPSIAQAQLEDCPTPSPTPSSLRSEVSKPSASHPLPGGFAEFWEAWPRNERKQDKAKCLDHWRRHALEALAAQIVADVRLKRGTAKWAEGYIEAPLVYLRGKRWEDGVEPGPAETLQESPASRGADETQAYLAALKAHRPTTPPPSLRKVAG